MSHYEQECSATMLAKSFRAGASLEFPISTWFYSHPPPPSPHPFFFSLRCWWTRTIQRVGCLHCYCSTLNRGWVGGITFMSDLSNVDSAEDKNNAEKSGFFKAACPILKPPWSWFFCLFVFCVCKCFQGRCSDQCVMRITQRKISESATESNPVMR